MEVWKEGLAAVWRKLVSLLARALQQMWLRPRLPRLTGRNSRVSEGFKNMP